MTFWLNRKTIVGTACNCQAVDAPLDIDNAICIFAKQLRGADHSRGKTNRLVPRPKENRAHDRLRRHDG